MKRDDEKGKDATSSVARDAVYWEERFLEGNTPWEVGAPSKVLFEGLALLFQGRRSLTGLTALSPGCGTGVDALALANAGAVVIAVDWSFYACARVRERLSAGELGVEAGEVRLRHGDFFSLPAEPVDLVCEHTFFCAIDPQMRRDYVSVVHRWLKPGGHLVGNFFVLSHDAAKQLPGLSLAKDRVGPPFATTVDELKNLLLRDFELVELRPANSGEQGRLPGMEWVGVFRKHYSKNGS